MISLVLYFIAIFLYKQILSQITGFDAFFQDSAMNVETEMSINFQTDGSALGRNMTFIFDSYDHTIGYNIYHTCYFYQNPAFEMSCRSFNRKEDGKWELTVRGDKFDFFAHTKYNLTFQNVEVPNREGKMNGTMYYYYNQVEMIHKFNISIIGKTDSPLITNILSNPMKRENTIIHYVLEPKYTLSYALDIQLEYPKYSFYGKSVSVIDLFNHEGNTSFLPELISPGGLGDNVTIEVLNDEKLKIVNALPNGVIQGRKYYFGISNLVCPEVINKQNFVVKLVDEYGNAPQMNNYNISVLEPGNITLLDFVNNSTRINTEFLFNITLQTDDYKTIKPNIEILYSKSFAVRRPRVQCISNCDDYIFNQPTGNLNHYLNPDVQAIIGMAFTPESQSKEVINSFYISGLIMPRSTKAEIINVTITSMDGDLMYMIPGGIPFFPSPGNITDISITLTNNQINGKGNMIISMNNTDPIIKGDKIQVSFCNQITIPNMPLSNCPSPIVGISPSSKCKIEKNLLTITELTEKTVNKSSLISFTVEDLINPPMMIDCPINITIKTSDNYLIDTNYEVIKIDFIPGSFALVNVIADNQTNSAITSYKFEIENNNPIEANGGFEITFPEGITLGPSVSCDNGFQCSVINQTVKSISSIEIVSLTSVSFTISDIKNPRSLKPLENMIINSISSGGNIIDNRIDIAVTNNQTLKVDDWNIELRSMTVYNDSGYVFSITIKEDIIKGDKVIIEIPNDVQIINSNNRITVIGYGALGNKLDYTINNTAKRKRYILSIDIAFVSEETQNIPKGEIISFEVVGLRNPNSVKPTNSFKLSIKDNEEYLIMESDEELILTMEPMELLTYAIYPKKQESNAVSDYVIYLRPNIPLTTMNKVVLIYPEEITEVNDQCIQSNDEDIPSISLTHDAIQRQLTFTLTFKNNEYSGVIMFECQNWKSVLTGGKEETSAFQLYTTTSDDHIIEIAPSNSKVSFQCFYPCEICAKGNKTQCEKCQSTSLYSVLKDGVCLNECPYNYSEDPITKTCVKCSSSCHKCELDDPSKCKSCSQSFPYYDEDTQHCLDNCPVSMYPNEESLCKVCSSDCKTCEHMPNKCTSCNIQGQYPFIYNNNCYESCPDKTMTQGSYTCIECSSECKTCKDKPKSCTSCEHPFLLLNKQCIETNECKPEMNYYPDINNGICMTCQEGCETCGNSVTECVKCKDTYIQKGTNCYKIVDYCPSGYYLTSEKYCEKCDIDLCLRCENSPSFCTACDNKLFLEQNVCIDECSDNYLIYNNVCVLKCPEGYIEDNRECTNKPGEESKRNNLQYIFPYKIAQDYFLLLAISLLFILSIGIIKCFCNDTLYFPCVISLISMTSLITFALLFTYAFMSGEVKLFYPVCIFFILQKFISFVFILLYLFYCGNDKLEISWKTDYKCSYALLLLTMLIIDYKVFKLFYSRFLNLDFFQVLRKSYESIRKVYCIIAIIELLLINLPLIVMCIVIIDLYKPYSFLYFLSIEYIIIIGILSILILTDLIIYPDWGPLFPKQRKSVKMTCIPKLNLDEKESKGNEISEVFNEGNSDNNKIINSRNEGQTGKESSSRILCTNNNRETFRTIDGLVGSHHTIEDPKNHDDNNSNSNNNNEKENVNCNNKYLHTMIENKPTDRDFELNVEPLKRKSIQNRKDIYTTSYIIKSNEQEDNSNKKEEEMNKRLDISQKSHQRGSKRRKSNNRYNNDNNTSMIGLDDIQVFEQSKPNNTFEELDNSIINNNVSHC